jgi:Ni,Fe-hydrogenase III component G
MSDRKEDKILKALTDKFKDKIIDGRIPRDRRVFFAVAKNDHVEIIKMLRDKFGFYHCSTVTAFDAGTHLEVIYSLFDNESVMVNLTARVPKDDQIIEAITPLLPSANLYEREVFDLIGVRFTNHPNMKRLVLPDEYPESVHPLLKDWKPESVEGLYEIRGEVK